MALRATSPDTLKKKQKKPQKKKDKRNKERTRKKDKNTKKGAFQLSVKIFFFLGVCPKIAFLDNLAQKARTQETL